MPEKPQSQSLAVLIDADNTSARHAHAIFEEIVKLGEANVRRIYGDFSGTRLAGWNKQIQSLAIIARHPRSYDREDMVFDPIHYLPLLEHKIGALDQAAPLAGWELPDAFPTLRRLLEARMGKAGKREYVQVLRLVETFDLEVLHGAVKDALRLGAIGYDAVKHLVLCRIERRPPKLDLDIYPYLPRANVATTAAASYMSRQEPSRRRHRAGLHPRWRPGPLLQRRRPGQPARGRSPRRPPGPARRSAGPARPRHPRRARLPALRPNRRPAAVPPRQPALRAHLDHRHHQPDLRRRQDDHRAPRSSDAPLRDHRDRKRLLALQESVLKATDPPAARSPRWAHRNLPRAVRRQPRGGRVGPRAGPSYGLPVRPPPCIPKGVNIARR